MLITAFKILINFCDDMRSRLITKVANQIWSCPRIYLTGSGGGGQEGNVAYWMH